MKTIEIIKHTGEFEKITETVDGKKMERKKEILTTEKEYRCEDGEEQSLLQRARLTAELWTRYKGEKFQARIQEAK